MAESVADAAMQPKITEGCFSERCKDLRFFLPLLETHPVWMSSFFYTVGLKKLVFSQSAGVQHTAHFEYLFTHPSTHLTTPI